MQIKPIGVIRALRGRLGDFVFRTYRSGKINVTYQPRCKKGEKVLTEMDRDWTENASVMNRLREILGVMRMEIVEDG